MNRILWFAFALQAVCGLAATNIPPALDRLNASPYYRATVDENGTLRAMVVLPLKRTETGLETVAGVAWMKAEDGLEFFTLTLMLRGNSNQSVPRLEPRLDLIGTNWTLKATETYVSKSVLNFTTTVQGRIDRKGLNAIAAGEPISILFRTATGQDSLRFTSDAGARLRELLRSVGP